MPVGIYILGTGDETHYKIGKSKNVPKRFKQIKARQGVVAPDEVFILSVGGNHSDELYLHRHFSKERRRGEYFERSDRLDGWVRWMYRRSFVLRDPSRHPDLLTTSDHWLPEESRYVERPLILNFEPWADVTCRLSHNGNDFHTHEDIIECVRNAFGGTIDLDPASHPDANRVVKADRFFSEFENGLTMPWYGNVWLNPPFGEWDLWTPKIISELRRVQQMMVLMPTRGICDQQRRPLKMFSNGLCIFKMRYPFRGEKATSSPDEGHAIFYYGPNWEAVAPNLEPVGDCFTTNHTAARLSVSSEQSMELALGL